MGKTKVLQYVIQITEPAEKDLSNYKDYDNPMC